MFKLIRSYYSAAYQHAEQIAIPRPDELLAKLAQFSSEGLENCEVISDFDYTLTQYKSQGQRLLNSVEVLQYGLTPEQRTRCDELASKYYPIEADPAYPFEEKLKLLETWYTLKNQIIIESSITLKDIARPLEQRKLLLRNGIESVFKLCHQAKLPVSVVSAGAGDIILESFKQLPSLNLSVLSNFIQFDADGVGREFIKPVVTSLTKGALIEKPKRKNAVVLGDLPSDLLLAQRHTPETVISVGFYNRSFKFEPYEEYDVLIMNDGNLHAVEYLLALIGNLPLKQPSKSLQPLRELASQLS